MQGFSRLTIFFPLHLWLDFIGFDILRGAMFILIYIANLFPNRVFKDFIKTPSFSISFAMCEV
jgi:hypothetical protein